MVDDIIVIIAPQDGKTALHLAAENGHVSIVQILMVAHADLNQQDKVVYRLVECKFLLTAPHLLLQSLLLVFLSVPHNQYSSSMYYSI